jgi:hypothetical protein
VEVNRKTMQKPILNPRSKRWIFRGLHIFFSIPIFGYIYSPFDKLPGYAPATRFIFLPVMVLTGLWMWKGHLVRQLVSKRWQDKTPHRTAGGGALPC